MKQLVRSAWALAIAGALVAPTMAAAQANKPVVAVLAFDNNSIGKNAADYNGIGKGVQDFLITALASNPNIQLIDRDHIQEVLQEQNLVKQGAIDPATAVRVGKLLGAQYMITGGFMDLSGKQIVLTARSINVETRAIANPQKVQANNDTDVLGLITQLSERVMQNMNLPAMKHDKGMGNMNMGGVHDTKPAETKPATNMKMDLRTAMLYSKALDAQDAGDTSKATELYNQVLTAFPNYTPAKARLAKLNAGGTG